MGYYCYSHFTDEETHRFNDLSKVTQLGKVRARIQTYRRMDGFYCRDRMG